MSFSSQELVPIIAANLRSSKAMNDVLKLMGESLLDSVKKAYMQKARGGTGDDGIKWEKTKKFIEHGGLMLIGSRFLLESFHWEATSNGLIIKNNAEYAAFQFRKRLPWPEKIPAHWIQRMLNRARPALLRAVKEATLQALGQTGNRVLRIS